MTATALFLVVASSLAWVAFDVTRKVLVETVRPTALIFLLTLGQVPLFGLWAWVEGGGFPATGYWPPAVASIVLSVVANVAFIHAFKLAPLSVIVPLLSLTPVFTLLSAIPILGELPKPLQIVGLVLVVIGAWQLQREATRGAERAVARHSAEDRDAELRRRRLGFWLMVTVAVTWSITPALDKVALRHASAPMHGFLLCTGVALGILALLVGRGQLRELGEVRHKPWIFAASLLASVAALGLQLLAIRLVLVSVVETLKRGIGNICSLLIGAAWFGETLDLRKSLAVAVITAGVALIVL
ncbi:MAG: DMT family transporter [Acidobacteriota bacterium]